MSKSFVGVAAATALAIATVIPAAAAASSPPSSGTVVAGSPGRASAPAAKSYPSCKALNARYPHGVGKSKRVKDRTRSGKPVTNFTVNRAVYLANTKRDRDKDGIACEKR